MYNHFSQIFFILLLLFTPLAYCDDIDTVYEKALLSFQQNNFSETAIHLKNNLQKSPVHLPSRILLIETFLAQNKGQLAEVEIKVALSYGADFRLLTNLYAQAYFLQNKFKQVIELDTPNQQSKQAKAELSTIKGNSFLSLRSYKAAEDAFKKALSYKRNFQAAQLGLITVAINDQKLQSALSQSNKVLATSKPPVEAWIQSFHINELLNNSKSALSAIDKAIDMEPEHLGARMARATFLLSLKQYKAAEQDVDYILKKEDVQPLAQYLKAIISAHTGAVESVQFYLKEIINTIGAVDAELLSNNPEYYLLAGKANLDLGYYQEARNYINYYLNIVKEDDEALFYLAEIELNSGSPAAAKKILTQIKLHATENFKLFSLLGNTYLLLDQIELAERYFLKAQQVAPQQFDNSIDIARVYLLKNKTKQAIDLLQTLLKEKPNNLTLKLLLVEAYTKTSELNQAKQYAQELVVQYPSNSRLFELLGQVEIQLNNKEQGLDNFQKAVSLDPSNQRAFILSIRASIELGHDLPDLISQLKIQLGKYPDSILLRLQLGDVLLRLNENNEAIHEYEKAYAFDKSSFSSIKKLVFAYQLTNNLAQAIAILIHYTDTESKNSSAYKLLGNLYLQKNAAKKALRSFEQAVRVTSNKGFAYMDLAEAQIKLGQLEKATTSVLKAGSFSPKLIAAKILLTKLYISQHQETKALAMIKELKQLLPNAPTSLLLQAQLDLAYNRHLKAEQTFQRILKSNENKQAVLGMFEIAQKTKIFAKAKKHLNSWLIKYPDDLTISFALAHIENAENSPQEAIKIYTELFKKFPENPYIANNLALLEINNNPSKALELAEIAYSSDNDNVDFIDTLAWVEYNGSNYLQALKLYRKAIILDSNKSILKYHLALTLNKLDRHSEAQQYLAEAVDGNEYSEKAEAEQLLLKWQKKQF